ncbi:hypothetical protein C349_05413 [Cryptococcus neoformans var. grubii Br795]|nr:hypothetical protein C368_05642 [Cryptococcus neoformans var. grubii 125.91]OXG76934.1 hypothetical protein C349_05413 [Cryptococcus neoformans var. grubii Br795]
MCRESPTSQFMGGMVTTLGTVFIFYHIWAYDKGKCLFFTRRSAFRWAIVWMFILSMILFEVWNIILIYVKYKEWYMEVSTSATHTEIVPVPYTLWSDSRRHLVRNAYQLLAIAWVLVLSIHSEETLYWAYLIGAIRSKDTGTWYKSPHFKVWVFACLLCAGVMPGVANIETDDLTKMEDNIFLAGSISAFILFIGSIWLLIVFPRFIKESQRQGANQDVLARLQYFKELNIVRTLFRFLYCIAILTLAIDGRTTSKHVNSHPFWLDLFYICGLFFVFASNSLSLMILLPRNMAHEAGYIPTNQVFVRQNHCLPLHNVPHTEGKQHFNTSTVNSSTGGKFAPYTSSSSFSPSPSPSSPEEVKQDIHLDQMVYDPFPKRDNGSRRGSKPWNVLGGRLNLDASDIDDIEFGIAMDADLRRVQREREVEEEKKVGEMSKSSQMTADSDKPFARTRGERLLTEGEMVNEPSLLDHFRSPADFANPPRPRDLNIVVVTDTVEVEEKR